MESGFGERDKPFTLSIGSRKLVSLGGAKGKRLKELLSPILMNTVVQVSSVWSKVT